MDRRKFWTLVAASLSTTTLSYAQSPPKNASVPMVMPAKPVMITPPDIAKKDPTPEPAKISQEIPQTIVSEATNIIPPTIDANSPTPVAISSESVKFAAHFGYYPTQWKVFPVSSPAPILKMNPLPATTEILPPSIPAVQKEIPKPLMDEKKKATEKDVSKPQIDEKKKAAEPVKPNEISSEFGAAKLPASVQELVGPALEPPITSILFSDLRSTKQVNIAKGHASLGKPLIATEPAVQSESPVITSGTYKVPARQVK